MELVEEANATTIKYALASEIATAEAAVRVRLMGSFRQELYSIMNTVAATEVCNFAH